MTTLWLEFYRMVGRIKRGVCWVIGHDFRWVFYRGRRCNRCQFVEERELPVKISQELDHIHGWRWQGQYHDTYHGRHTKENPETIFDDDLKEIAKGVGP